MKDITVIDDFFNEKELSILVNNLDKIDFTSLKNKVGNPYGFGHEFKENKDNKWLFDKIKKHFFKNESLKPVDISYRLRHNSKEMLPHQDDHVNYLFLAYLKGKELMYNGTGFYSKVDDDNINLDRYVGFKVNRVIFFKSFISHSDLQSLGESSPRYTLNIFYKYD